MQRAAPPQIEVVDDDMAAVYRAMPPARRLQVASELYASARRMLLNHLRAQHPDWPDTQVRTEAVRRLSRGAL